MTKGTPAPAAGQAAPAPTPAPHVTEIAVIDSKVPYVIAGRSVARIALKPMTFATWLRLLRGAQALSEDETDIVAEHQQKCVAQTLVAYDETGAVIPVDERAVREMPRPYAVKALRRVGMVNMLGPSIVQTGDGLGQPIIVRLSKPLGYKSTEGGAREIRELEFEARTMAKIAPVVSAADDYERTMALFRHCASAPEHELTQLPDGAINAIGLDDAWFAMKHVLPVFTDPPTTSSEPPSS